MPRPPSRVRNQRAELSAETKTTVAKLSAEARRELTELVETGRNTRAAATEQGRDARAGQTDLTKRDLAQLSAKVKEEIQGLNAADRKNLVEFLESGRNERFARSEGSKEERAARSDTTRRDIAEGSRESRESEGELNRGSREGIAGANRDQRQSQFETREKRLNEALGLREDSTWTRLEQQKEQAMQRAEQAQGKQGLAQVRAIIDAQDKHVRTRIMAYSSNNNLTPAERKKLLDQADMDYNEQVQNLKQKFSGGGQPAAAPAQGAPPPPKPGDVLDGHRFKGGDPSKQENWEPVTQHESRAGNTQLAMGKKVDPLEEMRRLLQEPEVVKPEQSPAQILKKMRRILKDSGEKDIG